MPDGDLRRPPQLWEQRLAQRVTSLGPGVTTSASSNVIEDFGTSTGYDEPADTITTLGTPSTPTVTGSLRMVVVAWDGLDTDGDAYNGENQWVDVHLGGSATFTPGTATLRGQLYEAGRMTIGDLLANQVYYAKLVGRDAEGNVSAASAAGSATTSLILTTDIGSGQITEGLVSFNAAAIGGIEQFVGTATPPTTGAEGSTWINTGNGAYYTLTAGSWVKREWDTDAIAAGAIQTLQIATGAITADSAIIANGAIGSAQIGTASISDANIANLSADKITAGTLTGRTVRTASSGDRIVLTGGANTIEFISTNGTADIASLSKDSTPGLDVTGFMEISGRCAAASFRPESNSIVFQGYRTTATAGDIILRLDSNVTSTAEPKFQVEADGDVLSRTNSYAGYSDARYKDNIEPARQYLDDLRDVEVVTFNWQGSDQKLLGVTAQQIQPIFPSLVAEDAEGTLSVRYSVFVPMLITAVQELAQQVDDLTARIEALEG
jgi:hypothetical protein